MPPVEATSSSWLFPAGAAAAAILVHSIVLKAPPDHLNSCPVQLDHLLILLGQLVVIILFILFLTHFNVSSTHLDFLLFLLFLYRLLLLLSPFLPHYAQLLVKFEEDINVELGVVLGLHQVPEL
jgi:hypothetical protein